MYRGPSFGTSVHFMDRRYGSGGLDSACQIGIGAGYLGQSGWCSADGNGLVGMELARHDMARQIRYGLV